MSLRKIFILYVLLQLPLAAAVMAMAFGERPWLFYAAEAVVVADVVLSILVYRRILRPLRTLSQGLGMLASKEWDSALLPTGQPEVDAIIKVFNRMNADLRSQRLSMLEQRHLLNLMVENSPTGVVVIGFDGEVLVKNPAAEQLPGPEVPDATMLAMADGSDLTVRRSDGEVLRYRRRHFIENGVRQTFFIIENVTEAVGVAEQQAYDKIIRLMAHEVNNTVAGLTTGLGAVGSIDADTDALLASCLTRAQGLSVFVNRLADVVRMPEPRLAPCDLSALVGGMRPFLESMCAGRGIELEIHVPQQRVEVMADAPMLEQALVNIVKNSAESIGRSGKISVEVSLDTAPVVTVTDNGPGIGQAKAEKIITPFFTDKVGGQGIGLTFVREALRRHRCSFSLATDHTDGLTRFTIRW